MSCTSHDVVQDDEVILEADGHDDMILVEKISLDKDDLKAVARKLRVDGWKGSDKIVLKKESHLYLKQYSDADKNTLLMHCVKLGKRDILDFLLKCDSIDVNASNKSGQSAADIAREMKDFDSFLKLLEADSRFPLDFKPKEINKEEPKYQPLIDFLDQRKEIHNAIDNGELDRLYEKTAKQKSFLYLSYQNQSGLNRAAESKQYEVFAYFQYLGARFSDEIEKKQSWEYLEKDDGHEQVKLHMNKYYREPENSHVLNLMSVSIGIGDLEENQKRIIENLYKHLDQYDYISLIMKVLKNVDNLDVVFDFSSEVVDRTSGKSGCIFGLADGEIQRIYIGAKTKNTNSIAGTLAHELCHLAMRLLYENDAKPYEKMDFMDAKLGEMNKETEFQEIMEEIQKKYEDGNQLHDKIKHVFQYDVRKRHSEMIVRVPHLLAMEKKGEEILKEQVKSLYEYYKNRVVPDCKKYLEKKFFTKPILLTKYLHQYLGYLSKIEDGKMALRKPLNNDYKDFLIAHENLKILRTSNATLGCSNLYLTLNMEYKFHFEKRCLFFELELFLKEEKHGKNRDAILTALKSEGCDYLVLVTRTEELNLPKISNYFKATDFQKKEVVVIVDLKCKCPFDGKDEKHSEWEKKRIDYKWKDLSDVYQQVIMKKKVNFQGYPTELRELFHQDFADEILPPDALCEAIDEENIIIGQEVTGIP